MVLVTVITKGSKELVRKCAPLDIAPSRRATIKYYKFHLWDFDSIPKPHTLSLHPQQIINMEILEEEFNPADFISWDTTTSPWSVARDWGDLS